MTISLAIYEDTGAVLSGHGTTRSLVTNCNWKNSSTIAATYNIYPLRRPEDDTGWTLSYTKYLYFKVSGTFAKAKNFKISIDAIPGTNTQLYGRMTNVYAEPTNALDGKMMWINGAMTWYPMMGSDPSTANVGDAVLSTGTYYTAYLATQLRVINSLASDVGNTAALKIKFSMDEY